ncbi:MAG: putative sulfate/molybdate transporter [Defluviitaleaceae bacterium]|nr:putative sulfate/molybdate transporter [Defluviitaleaceae bacterium]
MKNKFNLSEAAGAFGDLGTFIPFFTGYVVMLGMNPSGILLAFGVFLIIAGVYFKTPMPVQPMKAIGGVAIASGAAITSGMIWVAGLFTGVFWLVLALSGGLSFVDKMASKPVIRGIVLALGISFIMQATNLMREDILVAAIAFVLAFALLSFRRMPAMFALLALGLVVTWVQNPQYMTQLAGIRPALYLPSFALGDGFSLNDIVMGIFILAIPQIPLTLGNTIMATKAENNRLFPDRPVSEKGIAKFLGIMNIASPIVGGVPMCHGAGGLAAHTRFGAKTGGSVIILGGILLLLGLFFAPWVMVIFSLIPAPVLGVIIFFAGLELAMGARDIGTKRSDFLILLITAGFALWNVGIGFVIGMVAQWLDKKGWLKI